jgi:hypothetical protein
VYALALWLQYLVDISFCKVYSNKERHDGFFAVRRETMTSDSVVPTPQQEEGCHQFVLTLLAVVPPFVLAFIAEVFLPSFVH